MRYIKHLKSSSTVNRNASGLMANSSDLSLPATRQVAAQFPAQHVLFTNV
jgi:hypothetical protein